MFVRVMVACDPVAERAVNGELVVAKREPVELLVRVTVMLQVLVMSAPEASRSSKVYWLEV